MSQPSRWEPRARSPCDRPGALLLGLRPGELVEGEPLAARGAELGRGAVRETELRLDGGAPILELGDRRLEAMADAVQDHRGFPLHVARQQQTRTRVGQLHLRDAGPERRDREDDLGAQHVPVEAEVPGDVPARHVEEVEGLDLGHLRSPGPVASGWAGCPLRHPAPLRDPPVVDHEGCLGGLAHPCPAPAPAPQAARSARTSRSCTCRARWRRSASPHRGVTD